MTNCRRITPTDSIHGIRRGPRKRIFLETLPYNNLDHLSSPGFAPGEFQGYLLLREDSTG
jgi:hypothetical protein